MGSFFTDYFRSEAFIRYVVTIIASPIALKLGLDATQSGAFSSWLIAGIMGLVTIAPAVASQIRSPSKAALRVAVQADKMMNAPSNGSTTVITPVGKPNITLTPGTRGGQG